MTRLSWFDRLFNISLYLYPREFRQLFGDEMREIFQQQCQHQHNRVRLLGELLLDNLRAAPVQHGRAFVQQGVARMHFMMALLCLVLGALAVRGQAINAVSNAIDSAAVSVVSLERQREADAWQALRSSMGARAITLLDASDSDQRLYSALLLARDQRYSDSLPPGVSSMSGDSFPADRIATILNSTLISDDNPLHLQAAAAACAAKAGCNPTPFVARLNVVDPANAASWMLSADLLAERDPPRAKRALTMALSSEHYQSYHRDALATWYADVWRQQTEPRGMSLGNPRELYVMFVVEMNFLVGPLQNSCRHRPLDRALCQQVAQRWMSSADDFYTALWMGRSAQDPIDRLPRTDIDSLASSFREAYLEHGEDRRYSPASMAARTRRDGSLAMMSELASISAVPVDDQ